MPFDPISILIIAASFLVALTIHEFAHALAADKLGDPNPRLSGRLTLNPIAHLDPIGTVILPLFLILSGSPIVFGWAKPVLVDAFNFKNNRRDMGLVSLAGPGANLLLGLLLSLILKAGVSGLPASIFLFLIINNVSLAIFNLIPIHPLDGGKILVGFLPPNPAHQVDVFLREYGRILLLFLIFPFFGSSLVSRLISPIIRLILSLLISFPQLV